MSYFSLITRSFTEVSITDHGIDTIHFLEATDGLINMFDLFGSPAFAVVQNDLKGNVQKIRQRYHSNVTINRTLQNLLIEEDKEPGKPLATEALLWLTRGLHFTSYALDHSLHHPDNELDISFKISYDLTLSPYHSFFVRPMFQLAVKSMPWRQDFYQKIGMIDEKNLNDMKEWINALKKIINIIQEVFTLHPEYTKRLV
ncbi:glycolipid transfer protein domain-containing protein [Halteromyces radiatus]|uniref:glycolipid transfer protein domain-containing protein n=1 Tax=Halteromyces radiatus TaxID=101107 RepID=UPI00221FF3AF|nr:glycolipid transfer protein domain-containing protein [Halteromyces radiatus]KAI8096474.1 glycolipid transfer protein domain-containing protein [Halteromyces radiatus]